ncbi:bifunctional folylpolyglutamate synthase/dihydrofolate synthase [Oceanobacillus kapialis]|uniref:bifunctional folylpolyglutamate synthase/dihydrofolate synthase n=1 Tax=Oceanobacillus kapialis TaxID=481353 RepID=UPI00384B02F4
MFTTFEQVVTFFDKRKSLGIKPGLERIRALLEYCGEPQRKMKAIHIAGTNGKGSTSHFIKDALIANNYHTGLFTSPSVTLNGHIWYQDRPITESEFIIALNELYPAIEKLDSQGMHPTEFEIITVVAFLYFSKHTEIAVIEAGMGGRADTTNCFEPILSIITNVAKDHTAFLGDNLKQIAYHKAGIIKEGVPVITGELAEEANFVVLKVAEGCKAPLYQLGTDFTVQMTGIKEGLQHLIWWEADMQYELQLKMKGVYQAENAALALKAFVLLKEQGFRIHMNTAIQALQNTSVPGRFEQISETPTIILDGAHNSDGIKSFIRSVEANYPNKQRRLLFGVFKDKDIAGMLEGLQSSFTSIRLTTFEHPRAASKEHLTHYTSEMESVSYQPWRESVKEMTQPDVVYFITGSLHFIMQVRKFLNE